MMPETFEAHGKTWTPHTPGDPMPCEPGLWVEVLTRHELEVGPYFDLIVPANEWDWDTDICAGYEIVGWRLPDGQSNAK